MQVSHFAFRDLFLACQISDFRFPISYFQFAASHYAFLLTAFGAWSRMCSNFRFAISDFSYLITIAGFVNVWGTGLRDLRFPVAEFIASPDSKFSGQGNPASSFLIPISRDVFAENLVNIAVFACFLQKTL